MQDYLLDRETLGQFVDELMKKRPLPVDNAEEIFEQVKQELKSDSDDSGESD